MNYTPTYRIIYGREDINKECKFCEKVDHKTFSNGCGYGYECIIKPEKRKLRRCRVCYFGSNKIKFR